MKSIFSGPCIDATAQELRRLVTESMASGPVLSGRAGAQDFQALLAHLGHQSPGVYQRVLEVLGASALSALCNQARGALALERSQLQARRSEITTTFDTRARSSGAPGEDQA